MKNIKLLGIVCTIICFSFHLSAQSNNPEKVVVNGKSYYKKSCQSNVVKGPVKCILCSDQKLSLNCQEYTRNENGVYTISPKPKNSIVSKTATKKPTTIKGDPDDGGEVTKKKK